MVSRTELLEQFDEMGLEPSESVLEKCISLCFEYHLSESDLVEHWMAFCVSCLGETEPTLAHLDDMERKVLSKPKILPGTPPGAYKPKTANSMSSGLIKQEPNYDGDDFMSTYLGDSKLKVEPVDNVVKMEIEKSESSQNSSQQSTNDTSTSKIGPKNIINVRPICSFGGNPKSTNQKATIQIKEIGDGNNNSMYMHNKLIDSVARIAGRLRSATELLLGDQNTQTSQGDIKLDSYVGMIQSDGETMLTRTSTQLCVLADGLMIIPLNFDELQNCSGALYPGQIVRVDGTKTRGTFNVSSFQTLPMPPSDFKYINVSQDFTMAIAAGPFTDADDLHFKPLHKLIAHFKRSPVNVLLLVGPFLPIDNCQNLSESFQSIFSNMCSGIMDALSSVNTKVLMVASCRDAISNFAFPTKRYSLPTNLGSGNLTFLPDPCLIEINGVRVGVTATDILEHMGANMLTINTADNVRHSITAMIQERSFYPLLPPDMSVNYDDQLASELAIFSEMPHVLITPSGDKIKYFARNVSNCLAINPGRLSLPDRNTFAIISASKTPPPPSPKPSSSTSAYVPPPTQNLSEFLSTKIFMIT